jgi:hypothetical protein
MLMWGTLSDERMGLPFTIAVGPSQVQSFLGLIPMGLAAIFYCLRFETSFLSPPMTRRATVEVFDPASMWDSLLTLERFLVYSLGTGSIEDTVPIGYSILACVSIAKICFYLSMETCLFNVA